MSQRSLQSCSTLSLITTLTKGQADLGYNVLLDLTGQFRLHDVNQDVTFHSLLDDTLIAMTMYGRGDDARRLKLLCQSICDTHACDSSVLFLLLMCARNLHCQQPSRPDSIFGLDKLLKIHDEQVASANLNLFRAPSLSFSHQHISSFFKDFPDPITTPWATSSSLSHQSNSSFFKDRPDYIAHAARLRLSNNAKAVLRAYDDQVPQPCRTKGHQHYPASFQTANRLLAFLKMEYRRFQKHGNPIKRLSDALSATASIAHPMSRELEFLYFILSRCVSDPDVDESNGLSHFDAVARSPLALTMLQENNVFEEQSRRAHTERTRCVHRRRTLVNEHLGPKMVTSDQVSDLIIRSALFGSVYRDLVSFADAYMSTADRRTLRAVACFAFKFARTYFQTILSTAGDEKIPLHLRVAAVAHAAEQFVADGCIVTESLTSVENTDGSAVAVINVLLSESVKHSGNETVMQLLYTALTPYFDYIFDWVFQGSSRRDLGGEFFATVLGNSSTASEQLFWSMQFEDDTTVDLPPFPDFLTPSEALFLLRAGRGRNLLEFFGLNCGALAERPEDFSFEDINICFDDVKQRFLELANRVEAFADSKTRLLDRKRANDYDQLALDDDSASPAWKNRRDQSFAEAGSTIHQRCSHIEEHRIIEDTSFSPDSVRSLVFRFPEMFDEDNSDWSQSPLNAVDRKASLLFSSFDIDDVETNRAIEEVMPGVQKKPRFPMGGVFMSELFKPLARIDIVVQREVLRYVIEDLGLYEHIHNLRAHVLLGAGDFANELIDQMDMATRTSEANERFIRQRANASMTFYGGGGPGERIVRDRAYLNQCLRTALNLCSSVANAHADLLYLDSESGGSSDQTPGLWGKQMEMRYDVEYPLSIVITEEGMRKYSKIFCLFLRILRARKSLRRLFMSCRRKRDTNSGIKGVTVSSSSSSSSTPLSSSPLPSPSLRSSSDLFKHGGAVLGDPRLAARVWQFCWQANHFVSIFGGFVIEQVLGSCWDEFEAKWKHMSSVWEWRDTHRSFLDQCLRRCLLDVRDKTVLKVMTDGFEIVASVENDVVQLTARDVREWTEGARNVMDLLTSATASLKRRCAFLIDVPLLRTCRSFTA